MLKRTSLILCTLFSLAACNNGGGNSAAPINGAYPDNTPYGIFKPDSTDGTPAAMAVTPLDCSENGNAANIIDPRIKIGQQSSMKFEGYFNTEKQNVWKADGSLTVQESTPTSLKLRSEASVQFGQGLINSVTIKSCSVQKKNEKYSLDCKDQTESAGGTLSSTLIQENKFVTCTIDNGVQKYDSMPGTYTLPNDVKVRATKIVVLMKGDVVCDNKSYGQGTISVEQITTRELPRFDVSSGSYACGNSDLHLYMIAKLDNGKVLSVIKTGPVAFKK